MRSVPVRPRLKPWYRVAAVEDGLAVEYGEAVLRFGGRAATALLPLLLPLLDGTRTLAELERSLGEHLTPALENALERLAEHGLLADGPGEAAPSGLARTLAFCAAGASELDEAAARRALREASVTVVGNGPLAGEVVRILRLCGVADVLLDGWEEGGGGLAVVAPSPSELDRVPVWNRTRLDAGAAWLLVLPFNGRRAVVGPFVVPGETACYDCFRLRRAANCGFAEEFWALEQADATGWGSTPALDALVAGAAGSLVLRWVLAHDPLLPGRFFTVGFDDALEVAAHSVYRVPRCPCCSGIEAVADPLPWADVA